MNFVTAITTCFKKYADFSGRARRSEFWYFVLFGIIVSVLLAFLPEKLGLILTGIFQLAILVPSFALSWRRMHDIGKKGTWSLIAYIPIVGFIIALIWCCKDSDAGENEYGPNPKALDGAKA